MGVFGYEAFLYSRPTRSKLGSEPARGGGGGEAGAGAGSSHQRLGVPVRDGPELQRYGGGQLTAGDVASEAHRRRRRHRAETAAVSGR